MCVRFRVVAETDIERAIQRIARQRRRFPTLSKHLRNQIALKLLTEETGSSPPAEPPAIMTFLSFIYDRVGGHFSITVGPTR